MQHDSRAYLWDVRKAADAILDIVAGIDQKTYAATEVIHSAVERKFQIIGEALNQLSKADPALAASIPDLPRIVAFRNAGQILAHFDRISEAPEAVASLRRFILDLAVRGRLVEQNPKDEPAHELLKRIQASCARWRGSLRAGRL